MKARSRLFVIFTFITIYTIFALQSFETSVFRRVKVEIGAIPEVFKPHIQGLGGALDLKVEKLQTLLSEMGLDMNEFIVDYFNQHNIDPASKLSVDEFSEFMKEFYTWLFQNETFRNEFIKAIDSIKNKQFPSKYGKVWEALYLDLKYGIDYGRYEGAFASKKSGQQNLEQYKRSVDEVNVNIEKIPQSQLILVTDVDDTLLQRKPGTLDSAPELMDTIIHLLEAGVPIAIISGHSYVKNIQRSFN